jgi:hypothetical protein
VRSAGGEVWGCLACSAHAQRKGLEKDIWSTPMQYGPAKSMTTPRLSQMPVWPTTGRKEVMPGSGHHTMA